MPHARTLLSLLDLPRTEIERLWLASAGWKEQRSRRRERFADRRVATIFDGPALRTRLAYDTAIDAVGAHRVDLPLVLGEREPIDDTAAILSDAVDAVVVRAPDHADVVALAEACEVPVINAMTDAGHPVEVFSEAFSVLERRGPIDDVVLTFVGEDSNVLRSWCELTVGFELQVRQVCPPGHSLDEDFLDCTRRAAPARQRGRHARPGRGAGRRRRRLHRRLAALGAQAGPAAHHVRAVPHHHRRARRRRARTCCSCTPCRCTAATR